MKIHHIAITVFDTKASLNFYKSVLELPEIVRETENHSSNKGAWLQLGPAQLHLQERKENTAKTDQHFAIEVASIETIKIAAEKLGGSYQEGKLLAGYVRRGFILDPDKNRIELLQK